MVKPLKTRGVEDVNYQLLFESLPDAYIVFKPNYPTLTIVEQNDAHAKLSLTNQRDTIGKPLFEAFPDNSEKYLHSGVSDLMKSFERVIKTGKPDVMPPLHYDLKDSSGKFVERWWQVTHYPVKDDAGNIVLLYQATQDITEETLAANQLVVTKGQLDAALEIGLVGSWYWDIGKDVVIGDSNLAKMFNVRPEQAASGLPLEVFTSSIHPEDRDRVVKAIQEAVTQQVTFEMEYRTIAKGKKLSWVIARGRVSVTDKGEPQKFLGVIVDITERKEAESKLEHIRSMFNALFESSIMCIVMADLDGNVLEANKKFLQTLGYTRRDLVSGLNSNILTPVRSKLKTASIYDQLRQTGTIVPIEKEYLSKSGKIIPMLLGGAMLPDSDNLFMAFMLDISENKVLKALNVAKDEFIALASHQLRTPATAVKQYLGILIDEFAGPVTPDQLQYLNIAYNSNERQLTIINDLLKTAQLDTKGYRLVLDTYDINVMLREIIVDFKATTDAKKQIIVFQATTPHIKLLLDRNEMKLALTNLVENASKYTPPGKKISIRSLRTKHHVTITVSDEGVGIAKRDQEVIFEKFTRIDNSLSDTVSGTGLGLYWVKRIVDLHGGLLRVDSELGKGTKFTVRLQG